MNQTTNDQNKLIEAIRKITEHVGSIPKNGLLDVIANSGSKLLNVPVCIVWELDRNDGRFKIAA